MKVKIILFIAPLVVDEENLTLKVSLQFMLHFHRVGKLGHKHFESTLFLLAIKNDCLYPLTNHIISLKNPLICPDISDITAKFL